MTGNGEYYVRCKYCGKLIKVFKEPTRAYCTNCEKIFDYDTQDVVFSGITTNPSDYHYEWKEEKNIEDEPAKYKRAFEILKDTLGLGVRMETNIWKTGEIPTLYHKYGGDLLTKEEAELLEELMKK